MYLYALKNLNTLEEIIFPKSALFYINAYALEHVFSLQYIRLYILKSNYFAFQS